MTIKNPHQALIATIFLMFSIASCGDVKEAGKDVKEGTKNIQNATENLQQGLHALSKGLEGVDPLALKQILAENKSLREQVVQLTSRLSDGIPGAGVVEIQNRRVRVKIAKYTGSLNLNG